MIRAGVVVLAAAVLIDRYFLDGKYVEAMGAITRSLIHFAVG
jgi:predicted RNA-binding protein Jag